MLFCQLLSQLAYLPTKSPQLLALFHIYIRTHPRRHYLWCRVIGIFVFGQRLDLPAVLGMALILAGIVVINLFSKATAH